MNKPINPEARPHILVLTDACDRPESELFIGLKRSGFPLSVMCNPKGKHYQRLLDAGVDVRPLALAGRFDKTGTQAIRNQLGSQTYDVIHAFNPRALACGLRASKGLDTKVVAYRGVIGNISFFNPESWITFLHPRVTRIICVADAIKAYLAGLRCLWLKIPERKLQRIYKGHSLDWYREKPVDLALFDVPAGAFAVCCTGRDVPRKGFDVLVEAMGRLPDDVDAHLLLVGDVSSNENLRSQVSSLPHPERIHFTGFRNDAPAIAAACQVFVLPSTEREGLPRAVIEAMAYGVPAVVTDVGGMPELVKHDVTGYVVPPGNSQALAEAITQLYREPAYRENMGSQSQKRIQTHFHTSQTVQETGRMYQEIAQHQ